MSKTSPRIHISSGAPWESIVGYSRAVRVGDRIEVAGTTAIRNGEAQYPKDPYRQTRLILEIIQDAIEEAGGKIEDVVRTRIYIIERKHWEAVGKAHGEFFREIKPAATMVVVKELIDPALLVEIEVVAVVE